MNSGQEQEKLEKQSSSINRKIENIKRIWRLCYANDIVLFNIIRKKGYPFATIIHPRVHIPKSTIIGEGGYPGNGKHQPGCCLWRQCADPKHGTIGHDPKLNRSTVCSVNTNVSGNCTIGDRTYIAVHVGVRENIRIGRDTVIGMGSMVQRDILDNVIAMGNPARPMKYKNDSKVFQ